MSDSVVVAVGCVVVSIVVCDVDAVETSYIISVCDVKFSSISAPRKFPVAKALFTNASSVCTLIGSEPKYMMT